MTLGEGASAGPWPMEPGHGHAISMLSIDSADRAFDPEGEASLAVDFRKVESSVFLEWGATPRLTLLAQPVVQTVSLSSPAGSEQAEGFASSQIGARWLVAEGDRGVLSIQGALVAPGAGENRLNARPGDGGAAAEARVLLGQGWGDERRGAFLDGQLGYRWRADEEPDELRFDATFGVRPSPRWTVLTQSFSTWTESLDPYPIPETESHKAQVSVVRRMSERYSVQVGAYGAYAGRQVVEERALFTALWMRFSP